MFELGGVSWKCSCAPRKLKLEIRYISRQGKKKRTNFWKPILAFRAALQSAKDACGVLGQVRCLLPCAFLAACGLLAVGFGCLALHCSGFRLAFAGLAHSACDRSSTASRGCSFPALQHKAKSAVGIRGIDWAATSPSRQSSPLSSLPATKPQSPHHRRKSTDFNFEASDCMFSTNTFPAQSA